MKTTREAFEELISKRGWWKGVFSDRRTAGLYKKRYQNGILTEATMKQLLEKTGHISKEKIWSNRIKSTK